MTLPSLLSLALLGALAAPGDDVGMVHVLEEQGLTIELPAEAEGTWQTGPTRGQCVASWILQRESGGGVRVEVIEIQPKEARFNEPDQVTELVLDILRGTGLRYRVVEQSLVYGEVGFARYGGLLHLERTPKGSTREDASLFLLGTLLPRSAICLQVTVSPKAQEDEAALWMDFLESNVRYEGDLRNNEWEDERAAQRWEEHAPPSAQGKKFKKPLRTKHYVILTNSSGGKLFGKKMEENYKKIQKLYPFEEVEGRELMPVFLFRTPEQYYEFCVSVAGWSKEKAKKSKGHAWRDYYATYYEAPNDPVHIHEATHQIFANRLRLSGGGSWFQEGVAEYIETSQSDRTPVAGVVKRGGAPPLREFMEMRSLLFSSGKSARYGDLAGQSYKLAALFIEFLREARQFKKIDFMDFAHAVGSVPRNDLHEIEQAFLQVYELSLDEVEKQFIEYCKKR